MDRFLPMVPVMANMPKLAEAYVPYQQSVDPSYSPEEALEKGTMFPALYRPYDKVGEYRRDFSDYDV